MCHNSIYNQSSGPRLPLVKGLRIRVVLPEPVFSTPIVPHKDSHTIHSDLCSFANERHRQAALRAIQSQPVIVQFHDTTICGETNSTPFALTAISSGSTDRRQFSFKNIIRVAVGVYNSARILSRVILSALQVGDLSAAH